jgi:glycosyltransferase involved in cell wall biosynthesis
MRVLLANSEAGFRGGELQTLALARGLRGEGCEVLIASRAGSALAARAAIDGEVAEYAFERPPVFTPCALARLISRWRPTVLHAQTSGAHTHLWLARALVRGSPPLVVSRRVAFPVGRDPFSTLKYRTGVAHYIPISRAAAGSLLARGVSPAVMTVVPSGVDLASFTGAVGDAKLAASWGIEQGDCVIGTVAAFEREKGHRTLLDAAAAVLREHPRSRFVMAGEGRLRRAIERAAALLPCGGRIVFVPPGAPLEKMLPLFDVFVLPSLREGLSTALIAAMASGLPVVASRTGGIPEVVSDGSGILVPPGDAAALARAIGRLLSDAGLREALGREARKRASAFDIGRTVRGILEVYRMVTEGVGPNIGPTRGSAHDNCIGR